MKKWMTTTEVFDEYERRFAVARAGKELSRPWEPAQKQAITAATKRMLRYDEALVPTVHDMEEISRREYDGYTAIQLRYQTWENMYGASTLYLPHKEGKLPLAFVCCGHGDQGRLSLS